MVTSLDKLSIMYLDKINILHPNHVGMVVEEEYEIQVN